eukprot:10541393-Lingulodinium_polyedra.AAC.1
MVRRKTRHATQCHRHGDTRGVRRKSQKCGGVIEMARNPVCRNDSQKHGAGLGGHRTWHNR